MEHYINLRWSQRIKEVLKIIKWNASLNKLITFHFSNQINIFSQYLTASANDEISLR